MDLCRCIEMSSWLHLEFEDLDSGYVYCCSVPDAHRIIKVSFIKKRQIYQKNHVIFVQSMPAVPENSRLLTGISVEESQDLDVESPELTSQVIISLLLYN